MPHKRQVRTLDKNSLLYWYPFVKLSGVNTPKTRWVEFEPEALIGPEMEDNECVEGDCFDSVVVRVKKEISKHFTYPVFVRSDQSAAKHSWVDTCFVESEDKISSNLSKLLEENLMCDLRPNAVIIREFLTLKTAFVAFNYMPIAREFRMFASKGSVMCIHPYWPHDAIRFYQTPEVDGWQEKLSEMGLLSSKELELLISIGSRVTKDMPNTWSIDVCQTESGDWYVTDMALGAMSYHNPECKFASEIMKNMLEEVAHA